ncbi:MAG: hypothetical protein J2P25_20955, partial [Nocardiopsaceae bacterium]|nr:hypothetical protein [Nocardiopsaceae bacterium]
GGRAGGGGANPMNVVLSGVSRAGGCVTADVTPRLANRALFDHPYDHIPALVLTEAARQLAVASFGGSAAEAVLTGVNAGFGRHAELDQPLTAAARMAPVATAGASGDPAGRLPAVVTVT